MEKSTGSVDLILVIAITAQWSSLSPFFKCCRGFGRSAEPKYQQSAADAEDELSSLLDPANVLCYSKGARGFLLAFDSTQKKDFNHG